MVEFAHVEDADGHRFLYGRFQLEVRALPDSSFHREHLSIIIRRSLDEELEIEELDDLLNPPAEPFAWITLSRQGAKFRRWDGESLSIKGLGEIPLM